MIAHISHKTYLFLSALFFFVFDFNVDLLHTKQDSTTVGYNSTASCKILYIYQVQFWSSPNWL